jgi:hypothetical protein
MLGAAFLGAADLCGGDWAVLVRLVGGFLEAFYGFARV